MLDDLYRELNRITAAADFIYWSDQIADASLVAAPARHRGRKDGDQGGVVVGPDLARRPGQGVAGGHGRALDGQVQEVENPTGRQEAGRHRHSGLPLQVACRCQQDARIREGLIDQGNTCGDALADTAYRSAENEKWLGENGLNSRIHRKKPRGRTMSTPTRKANGRKSKDRADVEYIFAQQKPGWCRRNLNRPKSDPDRSVNLLQSRLQPVQHEFKLLLEVSKH